MIQPKEIFSPSTFVDRSNRLGDWIDPKIGSSSFDMILFYFLGVVGFEYKRNIGKSNHGTLKLIILLTKKKALGIAELRLNCFRWKELVRLSRKEKETTGVFALNLYIVTIQRTTNIIYYQTIWYNFKSRGKCLNNKWINQKKNLFLLTSNEHRYWKRKVSFVLSINIGLSAEWRSQWQ